MSFTGFSIGGTDLRTKAINLRTVDGWDAFPGLRGAGLVYPYRTGEDISGRKFYQGRDINLSFEVFPRNASGGVTTSPAEHLQDNLDTLMGLFHNSTGTVTITRTMPDATTRTAAVRVLGAAQVVQGTSALSRIVVFRCRMGHPFWRGASGQVTATGNLTNNGNAPIVDAIVTFGTAGTLTHSGLGVSLTATGACIVDIGAWTVTQGGSPADNLLSYDEPWWMLFEPGVNALVITGTVTVDYYEAWL